MPENYEKLTAALKAAGNGSLSGDDARVRDALKLVLAFMRITDASERQSVIAIVERLALAYKKT